jgi:hypothetical protein
MIKREEISRKYGESTRVLTNKLVGNMTDPSDPLGNLGTAKTVASIAVPKTTLGLSAKPKGPPVLHGWLFKKDV